MQLGFCRANEFKNQAGSIVSKGKEQEISQNDYNRLLSVCSDLIEELHELQKFTIIATHSTDAKARTQIEEEGKMVSLYKKDHYLGEGIYAGVFGGFLDWDGVDESGKMRNTEKNTYRFAVPLSECNLLINNPLAPRAMINIQHGSIDLNSISTLSEQKLSDTIPQAQIEGNPSYERDIGKQLNPQGVYLFRRLVKDLNLDFGFIGDAKSKSLIRQRRDETVENQKHLLIDTEEPPLIWASLSDICGLERITVVEDFDEKFEEVA